AKTAAARGAEIIGKTSSAGYTHCCSAAAEGDLFCGLVLDDNNQPELTPDRIAAWVEQIKKEAGI
ncbi:MAG: flavodoxin, partial [Lentisphaeria bacterium]|nr:flavodoxin [Lentisphaeria bacterium]